ncbi:PTS fructose transporter subunit IIC [uncultured Faecalibaculum sp.]|uniref:PTS fructose transporter subunit IIC n=1 Tax=uncultured Faecalibaculum sp. TaxID=1729681 RepID=UPI0025E6F291|nr:PTS fructose transporter subunit IIC [uncultured Faecalibaculum sp.]
MKEKLKALLVQPILTGISYFIPIICMGGLLQSFGTILGGADVAEAAGTFAFYLYQGGSLTMNLVVPVLAAYISYSVCDRPGLAPGFLVGLLSIEYKIGFVGGIVGGLAVGYFCKLIKEKLPLSKDLASLLPMLIIPTLGGLFAVLFMDYILGPVLGGLQSYLSTLFAQMQSGSRVVFGMVLGALMGVDLGGPVTKIGTTVVNGLVADGILGPEGAKVCIGVTATLGIGISTIVSRRKYTAAQRATGKSAIILGCCQIAEGGLPILLADPLRVWPATIIGNMVTGAIAMYFNVQSPVMMGGLFAFPVMKNVWPGAVLSVVAGTLTTIVILALVRKNVPESEASPRKAEAAATQAKPAPAPVLAQTAAQPAAAACAAGEDDLDISIEFE